jgi:hypothetical protein
MMSFLFASAEDGVFDCARDAVKATGLKTVFRLMNFVQRKI